MSSFDLRIHFVGLMMWVPEDGKLMHVLMPSTEGHVHGGGGGGGNEGSGGAAGGGAGGGVHAHQHHVSGHPVSLAATEPGLAEAIAKIRSALAPAADSEARLMAANDTTEKTPPHFVRLAYDVAYENSESTQLSREWEMVELTNRVLDLTGLPTSEGFDGFLPNELASLDRFANPVKRELVTDPPSGPVAARVTMNSGALSDYELGAAFTFEDPKKPQRITSVTEWTIRGIPIPADGSNPLAKLVIGGEDVPPEDQLPPLYPIGQTIHLTIYHMVGIEYPPHNLRFKPEARRDDDHFTAYFQVAESRTREAPIPRRSAGTGIRVRGDRVKEKGPHNPGSICGQARASLA